MRAPPGGALPLNAPAAAKRTDDVAIVAYLSEVWRGKWVVLFVVLLFVLGALYLALTATPVFQAQTVVTQVNDTNAPSTGSLAGQFAGLAGIGIGNDGPGRERIAILKSRNLVELFVTRYDLVKILQPANVDAASLWQAVKHFQEVVLSIRENESEGLTTVSVNWTDAETAARWANDFVALANEYIRARAVDKSQTNVAYLNQQIAQTNVAELLRVLYNLIETETKTLMLANARADYAFAIIDPAVTPERRTSPKRELMVISGAALGFFAGILTVLAMSLIRQVRAAGTSRVK